MLEVEVGTPPHQLLPSDQAFEVASQVPVGFTVIVFVTAAEGPPQPVACTLMVAVPVKLAPKFTGTEAVLPVTVLPAPEMLQV